MGSDISRDTSRIEARWVDEDGVGCYISTYGKKDIIVINEDDTAYHFVDCTLSINACGFGAWITVFPSVVYSVPHYPDISLDVQTFRVYESYTTLCVFAKAWGYEVTLRTGEGILREAARIGDVDFTKDVADRLKDEPTFKSMIEGLTDEMRANLK
jgi:hypothetical protein